MELEGDRSEEMRRARLHLRKLLAGLHILDALPERSRMLAVDAEIPLQRILNTVVSEQHPRGSAGRGAGGPGGGPRRPAGAAETGAGDRWAEPRGRGPNGSEPEGADAMRREGAPAASPSADELSCGIVPPSLPSNVLAEVCEFDPVSMSGDSGPIAVEEKPEAESEPSVRRWTSPDDGWGMEKTMKDVEKMPMGMPVSIGELADFLLCACATAEAKGEESERWAESRKPDGDGEDGPTGDMLEWSLAEWRTARMKMLGKKVEPQKEGDDENDPKTRLFVEERPQAFVGPVLVHRVPPAPPRPILCTDDPEASLLKAVELLLAYPELDALPVVSPVRCTVVAHLTLSCCLAYLLNRLRGSEIMPLADLMVQSRAIGSSGSSQRVFDGSQCGGGGGVGGGAASTPAASTSQPWVLNKSQPMQKLLTFFARTHHTGVPIVEDGTKKDVGGGILGMLSRRDLMQFLDLSMQAAGRRGESADAPAAEEIHFDISSPVEVVLETLRRHRSSQEEAAAAGGASDDKKNVSTASSVGGLFTYEKELSMKQVLLRILAAENRKLLFVQDSGGGAPQLTRILSVSDVWLLLIGRDTGREQESSSG